MTHDMRTTNEIMSDNEQPLDLSAELRSEVAALFAPMDRSLASSVTAVISMRRSRRRLLQGLWLGFSPVMAVAIVAALYVGGAVLPRTLSLATSKTAVFAPNVKTRAQGTSWFRRTGALGSQYNCTMFTRVLGVQPGYVVVHLYRFMSTWRSRAHSGIGRHV